MGQQHPGDEMLCFSTLHFCVVVHSSAAVFYSPCLKNFLHTVYSAGYGAVVVQNTCTLMPASRIGQQNTDNKHDTSLKRLLAYLYANLNTYTEYTEIETEIRI